MPNSNKITIPVYQTFFFCSVILKNRNMVIRMISSEWSRITMTLILCYYHLNQCCFDQDELNSLIANSSLSKESVELLASRLKKNILKERTEFTFYRNRYTKFASYFHQTYGFVYCNDIEVVLRCHDIRDYDANSWNLFIYSSKRILKFVLLHMYLRRYQLDIP